jgi:hypothetical protein
MRLRVFSALFVIATLVAKTASAECDQQSGTCAVGTAPLRGAVTKRLATEIDSGEINKSGVSVRTRFTIEPINGDPLVGIDIPYGALVEASWPERGTISLRAITRVAAPGTMSVRYQLVPSLEGKVGLVRFVRNASELLNQVGGSFHYDVRGNGQVRPWGWEETRVDPPAPNLNDSRLFSLPLTSLGIDLDGSLAINASAAPVFTYRTREIRFNGSAIASPDAIAKIPAGDADAIDISAVVDGELRVTGSVAVLPVVTLGPLPIAFSVTEKPIDGPPEPVAFQSSTIHISLPNVKVPQNPIGMGSVNAGKQKQRTVPIANTGELGAILRFESSDPQFNVPTGDVRVEPRGQYPLKVTFRPKGDAPTSATITVRSNDPDSPEQKFRVGANGSSEDREDRTQESEEEEEEDGGGCTTSGSRTHDASVFLVGLALALVAKRRRR